MGRGQLESDILPVVRQCFRATPAGVVRVKALVLPSYVTLCASSCPVQAGTCNYRIDSNTNSMAFFVVSHINVLLQIIFKITVGSMCGETASFFVAKCYVL